MVRVELHDVRRVPVGGRPRAGHPFSSQGLSENVEGGLVVFGDDIDMVGFSSSGHRGVNTTTICWGVDEIKSYVDGAALGGMTGPRIPEFDMLGDVPART